MKSMCRGLVAAIPLLVLAAATPVASWANQEHPLVLIEGHLVDPTQLRFGPAAPPGCPFIHLGAANGTSVTALDGTVIADPDPGGCHFGIWGQVPVALVHDLDPLFDNDRDGISNFFEPELGLDLNNPDSDGDGVPDGNEDFDGDGLTNAAEIFDTQTDPTLPDTDRDGLDDRVDTQIERSQEEFTVIPVVTNILTGPNGQPVASSDHAKQAVERANVVLEKAKIRLVPVAMHMVPQGPASGDDGTGGATANDGKIESKVDAKGNSEIRRVIEEGVNEIGKLQGVDGTGMKITFVLDADPRAGSPGASFPGQPVVLVEQRPTVDLTAATIAHEFGHALGIHEHPIDTDETTPEDSPGNFMNPSATLPGSRQGRDEFVMENGLEQVEITDGQIAEIEETGFIDAFGLRGETRSPAAEIQIQRGTVLDALGDQGAAPRHLDLSRVTLVSRAEDPLIHARIHLGSLLPASGSFAGGYRLLFDADASAATGSALAGFTGIDRQVIVVVERSATEGFLLGALLVDTQNQRLIGMVPHPTIETVLFALEGIAPEATEHVIAFDVRKDQLLLGADVVPAGALAIDGGNFLRDTAAFVYRQSYSASSPELTLSQEFVDPGATVPFAIAGVPTFTQVELQVDSQSVFSGESNQFGLLSDSFVFPEDAGPGVHFVVALAENGAIAYGVLRVAEPLQVAHDDGTFEKGYGIAPTASSAEFAMRIDPPTGRHRLQEVSVCWTRNGASPDAIVDFDLLVYDVGPDGKPGMLLGSLLDRSGFGVPAFPSTMFYDFDVSSLAIETTGPLFVSVAWNPAAEQGFFLCADESSPRQPGFASSSGAKPTATIESSAAFELYRALGIRARFERLAGPCVPDARTACLLGGRYEVRAHQHDFSNAKGQGKVFPSGIQTYPQMTSETEQSVSFWSFQDGNVEFFVKMNAGCAGFPAGHPLRADWLWVTGATTAESAIEVTDTWTGEQRVVANPKGRPFELFFDTRAFPACDATPMPGSCTSDATTACLLDRYRVRGRQWDFSNPAGQGALHTSVVQRYPQSSSATDQSASFYSFEDGNVEFFVKMNAGCAGFPTGHPLRADWLWVTGATTAESRVTVLDTRTLRTRTIVNAKGDPFALFFDTRAFPECNAPPVP